jgi:hypothetical protein
MSARVIVVNEMSFIKKMFFSLGQSFGGSSQVSKSVILLALAGQENNNKSGEYRDPQWWEGLGRGVFYVGRPTGYLYIPYYISYQGAVYECYASKEALLSALNSENLWDEE